MALYSEVVMDHFTHPRNVGVIENADGVGEVGNSKCGDIMRMYIKVEGNVITDCKFKTFGCGAAIATSSMATELIKGKTIEEALKLTNKAVVEALDASITNKQDKISDTLILVDTVTGLQHKIQIQNGQLVSFPVE